MTHEAPVLQVAVALDRLPVGATGVVAAVRSDAEVDRDCGIDMARRLMELGFIPGERLRVLHRGFLGGEPVSVKIGHSTFALRRFEADLVSVLRSEQSS